MDRTRYFGERLSENIAVSPEGYLICRNAIIGRSGFQTYRVSEITDPEGLLDGKFSPDDNLDLWRDPSEVFSDRTLSSFEGKTFTLQHPAELLDSDSDREHSVGHIQNIRKGSEPLDDGNWPMVADIVVKDREAIAAIDAGERQLSCGYTYKLARTGSRWEQRDIRGNHCALVATGRAGGEARIYDSAEPMESAPWESKQERENRKTDQMYAKAGERSRARFRV